MAGVRLDSQIFFTPPLAADPPTSPKILARRDLTGSSQDDPVLISSDDESDYGDLDDATSVTSFPPIEELYRRARPEHSGSSIVAGAGNCFNATSGASGDKDAKLPSVADVADSETLSSPQQERYGLQFSPTPPSSPILPRRSPVSPGTLQTGRDQPISTVSAAYEVEQASAREDATCGKIAEEISRATPPRSARLTVPSSRPDGGILRQSTQGTASVHSDDEDAAEPVQQPDGQDRRCRNLRRRQRNSTEDEDVYHPPSASNRAQEDIDGTLLPPRKCRKTISPARSTVKTSTRRQTPGGATSGSEQIRTSAPSRKRSMPPRKCRKTSSSAQSTIKTSTGRQTRLVGATSGAGQIRTSASGRKRSGRLSVAQAPFAKYDEFPLENGVLKLVTLNGLTTFQLEGSCVNHRHETPATQRYKSLGKRSARGVATRIPYTDGEDNLISDLKERMLPWKEILKQVTQAFPARQRTQAALQDVGLMLYLTTLITLTEEQQRGTDSKDWEQEQLTWHDRLNCQLKGQGK
ncbi:hypothetical protein DL764_006968 [Monosporascus ibericus]|uniref:Uncharacterized protein n=1 Tax=Monosporascus ibericus TaxID=155417 RepID=A0A4Q4T3D8_9PEZI|nr:hypothetical protein DL764_006968 [Monosporascus ibericus]